MRNCILLFLIMTNAGCATNVAQTENLNFPLASIQQVVRDKMPFGAPKSFSSNGREFRSRPFEYDAGEGQYLEPKNPNLRRVMTATILGDRRPYTLEVSVQIEKKDSRGVFQFEKYDFGMAKVFSRKIEKALVERREDFNFIDDFRAY